MLTAKSGEEDRIKGLGIGADDYVVKPFSPRELVARVKAQLRRTKKTAKKAMSFNKGLLTINTENHEVRKRGGPVVLTPTEFRILMVLAEKPGRVLSRLQLINMVQGYDFEGYDRTIDAHVKNLRHKIEDDQRAPAFIRTVYGVDTSLSGIPMRTKLFLAFLLVISIALISNLIFERLILNDFDEYMRGMREDHLYWCSLRSKGVTVTAAGTWIHCPRRSTGA